MTNSKRRCKQCLEYHPMKESIKVPAGWFCSRQHAAEFAIARSRKDKQRKAKADHRKAVMEVKPIGYWMKRAQSAFNAYIRERDKGLPCISCGKPDDGSHQRHASHYRSVGASPATRFHELNVWASCQVCNNHLSGNLVPYRAALIDKIGQVAVEWLEREHEAKRYRKEDYQAIEAEYKDKLKLLQK